MNPFVSRVGNQKWVLPITGMSLVLGFMVAMAWVTEGNRSTRSGYLSFDQFTRVEREREQEKAKAVLSPQQGLGEVSSEVTKLRKEKTDLENAIASHDSQSKVLNESLQESKIFAGLTELEGPGLLVTLKDSPNAGKYLGSRAAVGGGGEIIVHDLDVLRVVNELLAAGAEAVAINGQRVAGTTSYHCVGNTIMVDQLPISTPVYIRAIGDSATLKGAMEMPLGVLAEIRQTDPAMVRVDVVKSHRLPAYVGKTSFRHAKVPKEKKKEEKE